MNHLVSVVIPFFNEERYLRKTVECIVDQTCRDMEILLVDDGSTDSSAEIARRFQDQRIRIVSNGRTLGRPASRNIGIEEATGEFVTFMDADDECDATRIEKQLNTLLHSGENTVCGTWIRIKDGDRETIKRLPIEHDDIAAGFRRQHNRTTFVGATMMCRRLLLKQFKFREQFKYFEDWDLLARLYESSAVRFTNIPEPLYSYIIRAKSTRHSEDWYDYNIFARNCQDRRNKRLREFDSLEDFRIYLRTNVLARLYYVGLKSMIRLKRGTNRKAIIS